MPKRPKGKKAKPTSPRAKKRLNFDAKNKPLVGIGFSLLTGLQEVESDDDEERLEAELGENLFKERLQREKEETPQRKSLQTTISRIKKNRNKLLGAPCDTPTIAKILKVQPGERCCFPSLSAKVLSSSASQGMQRLRQGIVLGCMYYNRATTSQWMDTRFEAMDFVSEISVRVVARGGKNDGSIHTFRNIHLVQAATEDEELAAFMTA
jgi:hypothetical protein